jgi:hypothetical protein
MAELDITSIVLLISFFVIFGIFLMFDLFKRNEKYSYFAYIIVVLPVNYLWYLTSIPGSIFESVDVLGVYLVLFVLLDICLLRDLFFVYTKTKEFDDMVLFLLLGLIVQLIITAILPESNPALQADTEKLAFFWLPNVHSQTVTWNTAIRTGFQSSATFMVMLAIIPMILDIKDEELPLPALVIITLVFILPFLFLSFIWLPAAAGVLTFLMCLILFIILLMITKKE